MKRFMMLVQKMPFSGKFIVKELAFDVVASSTPKERQKNLLLCNLFLFAYAYLHGMQCIMGVKLVYYGENFIQVAVGMLYAIANFCVTLSQGYLIARVSAIAWTHKGKYHIPSNSHKVIFSDKERLIACAVTLGGQIIFLISYMSCC